MLLLQGLLKTQLLCFELLNLPELLDPFNHCWQEAPHLGCQCRIYDLLHTLYRRLNLQVLVLFVLVELVGRNVSEYVLVEVVHFLVDFFSFSRV